jgi:DNA-cytosine methyltransferase
MNVLSLFDGISVGRLALEKANIKVNSYYASEIDKNAINISQNNYLDIIQIGDVTKIFYKEGILYTEKGNFEIKFDLLIGGSICTSFSNLGKREGFNGKSGIISEYFRILYEVKPTYFLFENVKMKNEWINIISSELKVKPILINSNLLSAQNRKRLYWTNIPKVEQPENINIQLKDILENNVDPKYFLNDENLIKYKEQGLRCVSFTERRTEEAKKIRKEYKEKFGKDFCPRRMKELIPRTDNKSNCLTTFLTKEHIIIDKLSNIRYLTPLEFERLQTLPDNYTNYVSDKNRYKAIGNSWTVSIIFHIFSFLK